MRWITRCLLWVVKYNWMDRSIQSPSDILNEGQHQLATHAERFSPGNCKPNAVSPVRGHAFLLQHFTISQVYATFKLFKNQRLRIYYEFQDTFSANKFVKPIYSFKICKAFPLLIGTQLFKFTYSHFLAYLGPNSPTFLLSPQALHCNHYLVVSIIYIYIWAGRLSRYSD